MSASPRPNPVHPSPPFPAKRMTQTVSARIPTPDGEFQLIHFHTNWDEKEHLALVMGAVAGCESVLVRVHSECFTGDVLGSQRCDCGEQLAGAMQAIAAEGSGVVVYLRQEGRGIGLAEKLRAYNLQDQGYDTVDANLLLGHQADERDYAPAVLILQALDVRSIRLLTNNPAKVESLESHNLRVEQRIAMQPSINRENAAYLSAKVRRMRHLLDLNGHAPSAPSPSADSGDVLSLSKGHRPVAGEGRGGGSAPSPASGEGRGGGSAPSPASGEGRGGGSAPSPVTGEGRGGGSAPSPGTGEGWGGGSAYTALLAPLQKQATAHFQTTGRPFVTLSYAQSLDGCVAAHPGQHLDISAPASLKMTHALRAGHAGILVGIGTALADDPSLTVRLVAGDNPQPIVVDSYLRLPVTARLLQMSRSVWIATTEAAPPERQQALEAAGAHILRLPTTSEGQVDLAALLARLGEMGLASLMVEGGPSILTSFLAAGLADYAVVTVAPVFVGGVHAVNRLLISSPRIDNPQLLQVGPDMTLWGALA